MNPPIFAIAGSRGGARKSALCLGLIAHYRRKLLVVDLDPDARITSAFGVPPDSSRLASFLKGEMVVSPARAGGATLLPGGPALKNLNNPRPLRNAIADLANSANDHSEENIAAWPSFAGVMVDCPSGYPTLETLALCAANVVLIVVEPEQFRFDEVFSVLNKVRTLGTRPNCAIVTGRRDECGQTRDTVGQLAGTFNTAVLEARACRTPHAEQNIANLLSENSGFEDDVKNVAAWLDLHPAPR